MARRHARRGQRLWALVLVALLALTGCAAPQQRAALREAAPDAPDAPGASEAAESRWTTGAKQGVGTSTSLASKVWFTLGEGITHEVYYPQLDVPNVQDLQLIVTDGSSLFHPERDATTHEVKLPDPRALTYQQVNESDNVFENRGLIPWAKRSGARFRRPLPPKPPQI